MSKRMLELARSAYTYHAGGVHRPTPIFAPRIRVQGFDEELLWPLPPHQVAALRALYSHGPSIEVPHDQLFHADSDAVYEHKDVDDDLDAVVDGLNSSTREVTISLDKLVIDLVGDAEAWKPMSTHATRFATLGLTLPSDAVGGAVTFSHEYRSTTWVAVDDCVLGFYDTCSVQLAPITSGARATLFFCAELERRYDSDDSDDSDNDERGATPLRLPTCAQMQDAVAAVHEHEWIAIGLCHGHRGAASPYSLDAITGRLCKMVEYLVATHVLDVAFIYPNDGSHKVLFHPACHVPASVVAAATRDHLLRSQRGGRLLEPVAGQIDVCFWPKAHRVYFVGLETATSLLTSYVTRGSTDLLGLKTLRELASATIHMVRDAICRQHHLNVTSDEWANLSAFVADHADVDLAMDFLGHVGAQYTMPTIPRDWLRVLVMRCGWRSVLPPFLRLIRCFPTSRGAILMNLVAGLVENNRLCVRQRHATEFLVSALEGLLRQRYAYSPCEVDSDLRNALCVSLCLAAESADPLVGGALAQRLPLHVIAIIDSFGAPRLTLADSLLQSYTRWTVSVTHALPSVLMALLPSSGVHALQPYIHIALQLLGSSADSKHHGTIVVLLQLTHGTTSFDAALTIALASKMETARWARFLQTAALQLAPAHVTRLLAHITTRFDASRVTPLDDVDEVCEMTSDARGAVWIFAHFDHTPGLALLLAYAKALNAAHAAPITVIMDVVVPFHDQALDAGHLDFARTLAAYGLPPLTARLAALQASTIDQNTGATVSKRCRWCRSCCDKLADFARDPTQTTYHLNASDDVARAMCVPLRRYPEQLGDVCLVQSWKCTSMCGHLLVNTTDELVTKMYDAAMRLEASLGRPLDASSSPKRQCIRL